MNEWTWINSNPSDIIDGKPRAGRLFSTDDGVVLETYNTGYGLIYCLPKHARMITSIPAMLGIATDIADLDADAPAYQPNETEIRDRLSAIAVRARKVIVDAKEAT